MFKIIYYQLGNWDEATLEECYNSLPSSRRLKADMAKQNQSYREFLIAEYTILKRELKLKDFTDFSYSKNGKPYIDGYPFFSISHSDGLLVVAISDEKIGVDIERPFKEKEIETLKKFCSNSELSLINGHKNKRYFAAKIWTMKEASIKLLGGSVFEDLPSTNIQSPRFTFKTYRKFGHVITICRESNFKF